MACHDRQITHGVAVAGSYLDCEHIHHLSVNGCLGQSIQWKGCASVVTMTLHKVYQVLQPTLLHAELHTTEHISL